jgi:hypothetical protein
VTNLRTFSDAILVANTYNATNSTLTTVTTATPTTSTTASLFTLNAGANTGNNTDGFNYSSSFALVNSTQHTQSLFVKPSGATVLRLRSNVGGALFDFTLTGNGTAPSPSADLQSASIVALANGWYRVSWTFTTTTSAPGNRNDYWTIKTNVADGTNGFYVVGAQLEQSATVGEYIPTTSTINSAPRFDHNPTTGESLGLLVEEARTNSIRNNTGVGAVAGVPGTLPTNWTIGGSGIGTLTQQVVAIGSLGSLSYIDVRYSGTTSTTGFIFAFEPSTSVAALTGQAWTQSTYLALIAGSISNINALRHDVVERTLIGGTVLQNFSSDFKSTLTANLTRSIYSVVLSGGATTAYAQPSIEFSFASGVAIDFTIRIGLPQLELGSFATSACPTTTATVTRAADVASITGTNFSSWYNQTEGTMFADINTAPVANIAQAVFDLNEGVGSERIFQRRNTGGQIATAITDNGVVQGDFGSVSVPASGRARSGFAYRLNDFESAVNGSSNGTDTSVTVPTPDRINIGQNFGSGQVVNGTIRRLVYFPIRLANTTLQSITAQ